MLKFGIPRSISFFVPQLRPFHCFSLRIPEHFGRHPAAQPFLRIKDSRFPKSNGLKRNGVLQRYGGNFRHYMR